MEGLIDDLTRGNVTEVKVVLASVVLARLDQRIDAREELRKAREDAREEPGRLERQTAAQAEPSIDPRQAGELTDRFS